MGNFLSRAWDDISGVTAAGEASSVMAAAQEASTALGRESLDFMREQFDTQQSQWDAEQEAISPYREAGLQALSRYEGITSGEIDLSDDPTLQYLQQQGQEQVESSAAARGTQLSGRTLAGLADRGTSVASTYRGQILGELSGLMSMGSGLGMQATAGQTGSAARSANSISAGYGNLSDLSMQGGQIQAANIMGAYQGFSNIVSGTAQAVAACSRTFKENYTAIENSKLLAQINELNIEEWNYIGEKEIHVSPYAEDFYAVTGKGDGKTIPYIDMIGMLMGSVQELSDKIKELESK